ncbi:MAG: phosphate signaling complex protein PhoU [Candidatus Dadabacteria bacterium]|nr:phosphate signaling complex protein PhoU [Candidatus Dadabacteria bacterium]
MIRLEEEISKLKKMLFEMAASVEEMIAKSIKALKDRNMIMAEEVIQGDQKINEMEVEIDNQCIRILALYHPEAADLRTVSMIMKINNDLERIGDHAVNIAEKTIYLADKPPVKPLIDIPKMADKAIQMLQESLDAFVNKDAELAVDVCKKDDDVDALEPQIVRELITYMISDPQTIDRSLALILIAREIERVADLATNIAEDTYYIASGKMLKHHTLEKS